MFGMAVGAPHVGGFGIAPSEFWRMCPAEWWQVWEFNVGKDLREKRATMDNLKRIYFQSRK